MVCKVRDVASRPRRRATTTQRGHSLALSSTSSCSSGRIASTQRMSGCCCDSRAYPVLGVSQ
eukprot:1622892-Rhodomonas_salina.1